MKLVFYRENVESYESSSRGFHRGKKMESAPRLTGCTASKWFKAECGKTGTAPERKRFDRTQMMCPSLTELHLNTVTREESLSLDNSSVAKSVICNYSYITSSFGMKLKIRHRLRVYQCCSH